MLLISWIYVDRVQSRRIKRREKLKLSLKEFQGPLAPAKAQPAFEAYAFNLINLSRQSFSQGELEGGRNWNYHWKNSSANQHMQRPRLRLSLMILFPSIYNVTVSVKENKMEGETITEKIPEASFMHKVLGCGRWWPRCFSKLCLNPILWKREGYLWTPDSSEGLNPGAIICYMGIDPYIFFLASGIRIDPSVRHGDQCHKSLSLRYLL